MPGRNRAALGEEGRGVGGEGPQAASGGLQEHPPGADREREPLQALTDLVECPCGTHGAQVAEEGVGLGQGAGGRLVEPAQLVEVQDPSSAQRQHEAREVLAQEGWDGVGGATAIVELRVEPEAAAGSLTSGAVGALDRRGPRDR